MNRYNLKIRFTAAIAIVYIIVGVLTYFAFHLATDKIVQTLGISFATKQALLEKSRMMSAIQRDLSLSQKLLESPLLKRWAVDENNENIRKLASEELESYRSSFVGGSVFFVIDSSKHYYFNDGTANKPFETPRYTLNQENVNDSWYFRTMKDVDNFELNVDYDNHLNFTKVWFNVVMKDAAGKKIGLGGSGIDITAFVNEMVNSSEKGVETILISRDGAIEGHRDTGYVIRNSKIRGAGKKTTIYDLMNEDNDRARLKEAINVLTSANHEVETLYITVGGKRYLAAMSYLKEIKWYNLVLVDAAQVVSNRDFLPILAITVFSLLAVIIIIGYLLNRIVLAPLSRLAESSKMIAQGNYDIVMQIDSADEIGNLTGSFNEMARMVKDYTENLELKVSERTEELNRLNVMLAESSSKLMDSIRYAQLIQSSILPEDTAICRLIPEFLVIYRPRDIVGGDSYFFRETGNDFIIAVIDCTGHGVPGAFMTMTANAVLGHIFDTNVNGDPADILKEFNRLMRAELHHNDSGASVDNGLEIGLCRCNITDRKVVFAGARMDLLLVTSGKVKKIQGDRQAIGYRRSDPSFTYTSHEISLELGITCYLSSDGILDQSGGPRGWGFGRKRFMELLSSISWLSAKERKSAIEEALACYQGDNPQRDDITVVGFSF